MRRAALFFAPLLAAAPAGAYPDGPPWEALDAPAGCTACHSDAETVRNAPALRLAGLPGALAPGARYRLHITLQDPDMRRAGYLLGLRMGEEGAGVLAACDARSATQGAMARSTAAGAVLSGEGTADWCLDWQAPARIDSDLRITLWANAANGDDSPFGDRVHLRVIGIAAGAAKK